VNQARLMYPPALTSQVKTFIQQARHQLHQAGDPMAAEKLAREALSRDPAAAGAHEVLAQLCRLRDDQYGAFKHWLAALADTRSNLVEPYLNWVPLNALGRSQLLRLVALVQQISKKHPDPQSRSTAEAFLVPLRLRLGQAVEAREALDRRPLLRRWMGIAGFDNQDGKGLDTPYPPEREIDFTKAYAGRRGQVKWRPLEITGPAPYLELNHRFYPFSWNVAYLVTYVQSPVEQDVVLEITSGDPLKAWVNDRQVFGVRNVKAFRPRQFRVPVKLRRGHNKVLIKSCLRAGRWIVGAWFSRPDGEALQLVASKGPEPFSLDKRAPKKEDLSPAVPAAVQALPQGELKNFWKAISLNNSGLRLPALAVLSRYLDVRPKDPMALLFGVALHRAENQLQMAAQLVDRGVKLPRPYSARFLVERARLYGQRGQEDKAFAALERARSMSPQGLVAAQQMDRLLALKGWDLDRCRQGREHHRQYPDWSWPVNVLARCSASQGRPDEALRWMKELVRLSPMDESQRNRLVHSYLSLGRCHQARAVQQETTRLWPGRAKPFVKLGDVLRRCGRPRDAQAAYDKAASAIPHWHLPYKRKGLVTYELGDTAGALKQWKLALKHNPDDTDLWDRVNHLQPDNDPILEKYRPGPQVIAAAIAGARQVQPVEGASIVWLMDHEASRLMEDGTIKRVITTIRMAVDRTGRDSLGQESMPRGGMLKVLDAYTLDRRGRRREVTSMHGRKVRYPALQEGSIVVLQYRHIQQPSGYLRDHFTSTWLFQHKLEQAMHTQWILALPRERKLSFKLQGDVSHVLKEEGDLKIHSFTSKNVPPLRPEANSPPVTDLLRLVKVSTVPSWDYFSEWGRSLTSEVFEIDPKLERTLQRLIKDKQTLEQRLRAIYHFALTEIRYQQDYETFIAGVKPHPASVVLERGYGDCKDKSVLIIALMRRLGYKANLALVRTRASGEVQSEIPSQQFNHAVIYLPPQPGLSSKEGRFLDATAENLDIDALRPDIQGTLSLVLFSDAFRLIRIPFQEPEKNINRMTVGLRLKGDGSGQVGLDWLMKGFTAGALRKPMQNRQVLRQISQAAIHRVYPECNLGPMQVTGQRSIIQPLVVKIGAACKNVARLDGKILRLRLPKIFLRFVELARWTERRHPILFGPPEVVEGVLNLKLPQGATLKSHPPDSTFKGPCLEAQGKWEKTAGGVKYIQRLRRTCSLLPADKYLRFRAVLNQVQHYLEGEVVMTVKK